MTGGPLRRLQELACRGGCAWGLRLLRATEEANLAGRPS